MGQKRSQVSMGVSIKSIYVLCVCHKLHRHCCDVSSDHTLLIKAIDEAWANVPFCTILLSHSSNPCFIVM